MFQASFVQAPCRRPRLVHAAVHLHHVATPCRSLAPLPQRPLPLVLRSYVLFVVPAFASSPTAPATVSCPAAPASRATWSWTAALTRSSRPAAEATGAAPGTARGSCGRRSPYCTTPPRRGPAGGPQPVLAPQGDRGQASEHRPGTPAVGPNPRHTCGRRALVAAAGAQVGPRLRARA